MHNDEQLNKMQMERKDREAKMIEPRENVDTVYNERTTQSTTNIPLDKKELFIQTQNQKT